MSYDLKPKREGVETFHFGAFSFQPLIEACGYLWPMTTNGAQWYCAWGVDPRLGDKYPLVLSNDGFEVTEEEARIMARMARNFVAVQKTLPEENRDQSPIGQTVVNREMLMEALMKTMSGTPLNERWPVKIRNDFVEKIERFADWAERSGGFQIW